MAKKKNSNFASKKAAGFQIILKKREKKIKLTAAVGTATFLPTSSTSRVT